MSMYSPDLNSIFGERVRLDLNFIFASGLKSKTNLNTELHCSGKCVWGEIMVKSSKKKTLILYLFSKNKSKYNFYTILLTRLKPDDPLEWLKKAQQINLLILSPFASCVLILVSTLRFILL